MPGRSSSGLGDRHRRDRDGARRLILVGGGLKVVGAFWCQEWSGFFLALLSGILGVVVGLMLLGNPIQGGITLTILLASFLFVGGIFKAVAAIAQRFEGWG